MVSGMMSTVNTTFTPRPVASSVVELLDGVVERRPFSPDDARSSTQFEHVVVDGERFVLKHVHVDDDFTMRVSGDVGCRPLRVWAAGIMDAAPDLIDHAVVAAAKSDGRNGWGAALLLRDVSDELVPVGDDPLSEEQHQRFIDHCAGLGARLWGWNDDLGLLPHRYRWWWFSDLMIDEERELGWPERVPHIAEEGWQRFAQRAPRDVVDVITALRCDPFALSEAVRSTPQTFVHGDWKLGNLGTAADGRTVLLDWAYPGEGPICHELTWYLALNRSRLPVGETKESTIDLFRSALEQHGIDTREWWDRQLGLCLLGALVQFGWEKALGDEDELSWWCAAARDGVRWL
jgi:hypothetical protein